LSNFSNSDKDKENGHDVGNNTKNVLWLLSALTPMSAQQDKVTAVREIRNLARTSNDEFWQKNTAQVLYCIDRILMSFYLGSHRR
jgi:hypothetical protein